MGSQLKQWKDRIIHQGKSAGLYKCSLARHPWSLQRSQIHTGIVQHNHFITFAFIQVFFTLSHLYHVHSFSTVHQIHSWYKMPTFFHDNHNRDLRPLSFFIITLLFSDETPLVVENEPGLPPSWCPQQFQRSDWESVSSSWGIMIVFPGTVLFLEEDHFVSEDFLYVLNLMQEQAVAMPESKVTSSASPTCCISGEHPLFGRHHHQCAKIFSGGYLVLGNLSQKVQSKSHTEAGRSSMTMFQHHILTYIFNDEHRKWFDLRLQYFLLSRSNCTTKQQSKFSRRGTLKG